MSHFRETAVNVAYTVRVAPTPPLDLTFRAGGKRFRGTSHSTSRYDTRRAIGAHRRRSARLLTCLRCVVRPPAARISRCRPTAGRGTVIFERREKFSRISLRTRDRSQTPPAMARERSLSVSKSPGTPGATRVLSRGSRFARDRTPRMISKIRARDRPVRSVEDHARDISRTVRTRIELGRRCEVFTARWSASE